MIIKATINIIFVWLTLQTLAIAEEKPVDDEVKQLSGISIIGNKEAPKSLYIVPWKQGEIPDLSQPPLESLIDEALAPVDREVFQRKVRYYDSLSTQEVGSNEN